MGLKSTLSRPLARLTARKILKNASEPVQSQERVFQSLIRKAQGTSFGKDHRFEHISDHADFKKAVPLRDYEMLRPYLDRVVHGEPNVIWPGRPIYLCKTSGTTSGAKYIPLTKELLHNQISSARNALLMQIANSNDASFVDGKMIFLQGSPALDESNAIPTGRLSGIVARHVPGYLQKNRLPSYATNTIEDWETKVDAIVEETIDQDMRLISGIPAWVQMYFQRLLEKSGKSTVKELFPRFSLFVHGGVNYAPYSETMERLIGGPVATLETFPASEGFFAFQHGDEEGLLLVVDNGIHYEFVPADEIGKENPIRLTVGQVELGKNYAMILNTAAGLFGYRIGDIVKFTSLMPPRIKVVGRTKHFTSAFGEHVIAEEVEKSLSLAMEVHPCQVMEFTVAPQLKPQEGLPHHEWLIAFISPPGDLGGFSSTLDEAMRKQNPYYEDLIAGNVLRPLRVTCLLPDAFNLHMKSIGKLGGQNKVPRLSNDRNFADALQAYRTDR